MTRNTSRVGPATSGRAGTLDVDALLDDPRTGIIVCCGSGGVGKTTTSAALALRAAERGRKVVVLTIDPARRLAQSMGIEALDNTPRPVTGVEGTGSLDAMMLDMKRTFDEVVLSQASPEKAKQILANPFYIALSGLVRGHAGVHGDGEARPDPSRCPGIGNLRPDRRGHPALALGAGLPGRPGAAVQTSSTVASCGCCSPLRAVRRSLMSAGLSIITNSLTKILGAQFLKDLQTFVTALDTVFGGFRQRAQQTYALLKADGTAFLVVAAPEPDALREAEYFVERLSEDDMPLAGLVVNRASPEPAGTLSAEEATTAAERLRRTGGTSVAAGLLRLHADRVRMVLRERALRERFATAHPQVETVVVPALAGDVHDLGGLRRVGTLLADGS
ncbi:ArsA-related P-loop ATPase [Nocardioides convexus]|uniref:ArsA family ATPase n=1 Tax=Nocardioides convexus TaxID=2712224 RepID=UPI0024187626|nr:ArsA-related P-loop ATPase [Nocardioides convexus]